LAALLAARRPGETPTPEDADRAADEREHADQDEVGAGGRDAVEVGGHRDTQDHDRTDQGASGERTLLELNQDEEDERWVDEVISDCHGCIVVLREPLHIGFRVDLRVEIPRASTHGWRRPQGPPGGVLSRR